MFCRPEEVVGVLPENSYGVVGHDTEIFYEGPEIERKVLERLQLIPFEEFDGFGFH